jgi:hypothetical protein
MQDLNARLHAKLASLNQGSLAAPARLQVLGTNTVADELAFFPLRDPYHRGQLAYARK